MNSSRSVPLAAASKAEEDRGGLAASLVADEQAVLSVSAIRFISRSARLLSIGTLAAGNWHGVWIHREIPVGAVWAASVLDKIIFEFDAA